MAKKLRHVSIGTVLLLSISGVGCDMLEKTRDREPIFGNRPLVPAPEPIRDVEPIPRERPELRPQGVKLNGSPASTNAAMAAGHTASDLRIPNETRRKKQPEPEPEPVSKSFQSTNLQPEPSAPSPQPKLVSVESSPMLTRIRTADEGKQRAKELGVNWQKLEQLTSGEWQYSVTVPNEQNVAVNRRVEARDRDQVTAIQLVLDQIGRDRKP